MKSYDEMVARENAYISLLSEALEALQTGCEAFPKLFERMHDAIAGSVQTGKSTTDSQDREIDRDLASFLSKGE
jgi:hypothetical protein